jgi:GlpG protein
MRQLRELPDESTAQLLHDALLESGIDAQVMQSQRGSYGVWVIEEEKLPRAQALCAEWLDQGQADTLEQLAKRGRATRELSARIEDRRQRQQEVITERMRERARPRPALLTWGLSALCIAVAFITDCGQARESVASLLILNVKQPVALTSFSALGLELNWIGLPWSEPWRLITPVLLHFGELHIVLNVLWLQMLGGTIEAHHGARYLAVFGLITAAISNVLQLELGQSPMFGGLSGVVYGLLGLIWLRGRLDPNVGYSLSRSTVQFMLIWLAFGFAGEFAKGMGLTASAGIANWCHLGGLLVGLGWGYVAAKLAQR